MFVNLANLTCYDVHSYRIFSNKRPRSFKRPFSNKRPLRRMDVYWKYSSNDLFCNNKKEFSKRVMDKMRLNI